MKPGRENVLRCLQVRPCVYILASQRNATLYIGVTSDAVQRVWQHRSASNEGFTKQYGAHQLVYVGFHDAMPAAIRREKAVQEMAQGVQTAAHRG
ncbi:MAG TPA: GIY-YIG nuclease family protein [Ferrovibrio sp.]|uniref:GIY-YIG nuclease family protein n=1 Tax=Ferrovibrio sp. TaxID=1917215 RepID=UPI002ED665A7